MLSAQTSTSEEESQKYLCSAGSGESIQDGNSIRDQFLKAVYDQVWTNLKAGGVAQVGL